NFGQDFDVIRIVRAGNDRLCDFVEIDFDDSCVFCVRIGFKQRWVGQPLFHSRDATAQAAFVFVAVGDHPLQHCDVAGQILDDRLFVQTHGTTGSGALGGSIGQLECLFGFQV